MEKKSSKQSDQTSKIYGPGSQPMVADYKTMSSSLGMINCSVLAIIKYHRTCLKAAQQLDKDLKNCGTKFPKPKKLE